MVQIQAQSEAVAAAWQLIEAQKAELASQHSKLAQQTTHLDQETRQVLNYLLPRNTAVPESKVANWHVILSTATHASCYTVWLKLLP